MKSDGRAETADLPIAEKGTSASADADEPASQGASQAAGRAAGQNAGQNSSSNSPRSGVPVLSLKEVVVRFKSREGIPITAVDRVSLKIMRRETVGLVGETGCGKSTLARASLGLVPVQGGQVELLDHDIGELPRGELRSLRRRCQMIFQDPRGSLNPRMSVGSIIGEPLKVHGIGGKDSWAEEVQEMMDLVGLSTELLDRRPVQLSGGQQQRVGIARALITRPSLVICDEPVSALDVSIRAQILNLLADLRDTLDVSFLFIAHDLAVVRHLSDRVAVMYLGRIVEEGPVDRIFAQPRHPYTQGLVAAILHADVRARRRLELVERLAPGDLPSLLDPPEGCRYQSRCPYALDDPCRRVAPADELTDESLEAEEKDEAAHLVACHRWREIASGELGVSGVVSGALPLSSEANSDISVYARPPEQEEDPPELGDKGAE